MPPAADAAERRSEIAFRRSQRGTVDVATTAEALLALKPEYDRLSVLSGNMPPFPLHEWHGAWWNHLAKTGGRVRDELRIHTSGTTAASASRSSPSCRRGGKSAPASRIIAPVHRACPLVPSTALVAQCGPAVFEAEQKQALALPPAPRFAQLPQAIVPPHPSGTVPQPARCPPQSNPPRGQLGAASASPPASRPWIACVLVQAIVSDRSATATWPSTRSVSLRSRRSSPH
jgi:hypothetical protein